MGLVESKLFGIYVLLLIFSPAIPAQVLPLGTNQETISVLVFIVLLGFLRGGESDGVDIEDL